MVGADRRAFRHPLDSLQQPPRRRRLLRRLDQPLQLASPHPHCSPRRPRAPRRARSLEALRRLLYSLQPQPTAKTMLLQTFKLRRAMITPLTVEVAAMTLRELTTVQPIL